MKSILKKLMSFIIFIISVLIIIAGFFSIKGYNMYRDAVSECPLNEKIHDIRTREDFTSFDKLPEMYVKAVVSAEDKRFWKHHGIDLLAIGRAVWNDIRTLSFAEGGSTITQQLMKNEYFTQEKKLERKFAEIFAARAIEKECSKEEIFELYANTIYFGGGYYGIYDAAKGYFGKTLQELADYECILLAGLPNAPSAYSPYTNPGLAEQRMKQVTDRMVKCGVISQQQANSFIEEYKNSSAGITRRRLALGAETT